MSRQRRNETSRACMRLGQVPMITRSVVLAVLVIIAVDVLLGCYPKNCDPKTDPLRCQCPPGACGDYPPEPSITETRAKDAGKD